MGRKSGNKKRHTRAESKDYFCLFSTEMVATEFPNALRKAFVHMWNKRLKSEYGEWKDTSQQRGSVFGKYKVSPQYQTVIKKPFQDWDCTALTKAILNMRHRRRNLRTLYESYIQGLEFDEEKLHSFVAGTSGNADETFARAVFQLDRLRNVIYHSNGKLPKAKFDYYVNLAKEAFTALNLDTKCIDDAIRNFFVEKGEGLKSQCNEEKVVLIKQIEEREEYIRKANEYTSRQEKELMKRNQEIRDLKLCFGLSSAFVALVIFVLVYLIVPMFCDFKVSCN